MENSGIFKTKDNRTFRSLDHDWMAWRTMGFSKQKIMVIQIIGS
jgi:hypothetical protein